MKKAAYGYPVAAAMVALLCLAGPASEAQGPFGGRPGPPPGGAFGPRSGMPPFGGPRKPSVVGVPVEYLASELSLTPTQKSKVAKIQQQFRDSLRALFPGPPGFGRPGGPPPGGRMGGPPPGAPPAGGPMGPGMRPGGMDAIVKQIQAQEKKATGAVNAVLTAGQRQKLAGALTEADVLRRAGIPLQVVGQLKLTPAQKKRLAAIAAQPAGNRPGDWFQARRQAEQASLKALDARQRKVVETYRRSNSRFSPGGGFGPPFGRGR